MTSRTTKSFRKLFTALTPELQRAAEKAYRKWRENPAHPSLDFKRVHATQPIYSARITLGCRSVGVLSGTQMVWFWLGSHNDYDNLLHQL